jgi:hypothetical protein
MSSFNFDEILNGDIIDKKQNRTPTVRKGCAKSVDTWNKVWEEVNGEKFEDINGGNLLIACNELEKFCKSNGLDMEVYLRWGLSTFENIFSPRYFMLSKVLKAYNQIQTNQVAPDSKSGYMIVETNEVVDFIYQEDGQVMLEFPLDGIAYTESGDKVHIVKVGD